MEKRTLTMEACASFVSMPAIATVVPLARQAG
jgi:hypothetical protein